MEQGSQEAETRLLVCFMEELEGPRPCRMDKSRGGALGPEVGAGSEARPLGRGHPFLFILQVSNQQEPVPFFLGPGEAFYGSRKVPIRLKVTQSKQLHDPGTQVSPAAFSRTKKQPWGSQD